MPSARHRDELVLNSFSLQLLCHQDGLLVWHIRIVVPVKKHCGRVILGDISKRAERIEAFSLFYWIKTGHFQGPKTLLASVKIESPAVPALIFRDHLGANCLISLL